jgi:hypothetical protein
MKYTAIHFYKTFTEDNQERIIEVKYEYNANLEEVNILDTLENDRRVNVPEYEEMENEIREIELARWYNLKNEEYGE